jgi:hypothetical protein
MDPEDQDSPLFLQDYQIAPLHEKSHFEFVAGGWGSGKTYFLLAKIFQLCFANPPHTRGAVILPTGPLLSKFLRAQFMPAFRHLIVYYNKAENISILPGGREIYFISAFEPQRLEAITLAWCCGDEAGLWDHEVFRRMDARTRDKRATYQQIAFVGLPLWGWLQEEFDGTNPRRTLYHISTDENKKTHPDYYGNLLESCPASQRDCYLGGRFMMPGGRVFSEIKPEVHDIPWRFRPDFQTVPFVDYSPRTPHVLFAQLLPPGTEIGGKKLDRFSASRDFSGMVIVDEMVPDGSREARTTEKVGLAIRD